MNSKAWYPAYVLHARAYRETSVLADLFLPEFGRITAIARGARIAVAVTDGHGGNP